MDIKEEKICRLCFNHAKTEFEVINEVAMEMLDVLLLKMNLDVSESPIMCQNCSKTVKRCYNFKSMCKATEKCFIKNEAKIESTDERVEGHDVDESSSKCGFCMNPQTENDIVPMDVLINEPKFAKIWSTVMPTMDIKIFKNSLICINCQDNLVSYFNLVQICWDTEEKINTYCHSNGTNSEAKVNLNNVQCFITKDISEDSDKCANNQELCDDLLIHEELHIEEDILILKQDLEMYKCALCPYETKYNGTLISHMLVHKDTSEVEMYICEWCNYRTKRKSNLKSHIIIHKDISEIEMYKCTECIYQTKFEANLKRHVLSHRNNLEVKMHKCTKCLFKTNYKGSLTRHMLIHKDSSEVAMYKCAHCVFKTKHKGNLIDHMLIHRDTSEVEMYKCTMCIYETKHKAALRKHIMLIHRVISEVGMYKCTACIYQTKFEDNLKKHVLSHKDNLEGKMYKCTKCLFETKYKRSLERHMSQHKDSSRVAKCKCALCVHNLNDHNYAIPWDTSEVDMHKCTMCPYETKNKRHLKTHVLSHKESEVPFQEDIMKN